MRPRGLSFPFADHMNRLLSGGIRSYLRPLGLLESHLSLVFFSVCQGKTLSVHFDRSYVKRDENGTSK